MSIGFLCITLLCTCSLKVESFAFLYSCARVSLLNYLNSVDRTLLKLLHLFLVNLLLCGCSQFDDFQNAFILNLCISYIKKIEILSGPFTLNEGKTKYFIVSISFLVKHLFFQGFPYWGEWGDSPTKGSFPKLNKNVHVITQYKQYL